MFQLNNLLLDFSMFIIYSQPFFRLLSRYTYISWRINVHVSNVTFINHLLKKKKHFYTQSLLIQTTYSNVFAVYLQFDIIHLTRFENASRPTQQSKTISRFLPKKLKKKLNIFSTRDTSFEQLFMYSERPKCLF